jgi:hypothetical protein
MSKVKRNNMNQKFKRAQDTQAKTNMTVFRHSTIKNQNCLIQIKTNEIRIYIDK